MGMTSTWSKIDTAKLVMNKSRIAAVMPKDSKNTIRVGYSSNVPLCKSSPTKVKQERFKPTATPHVTKIVTNGSLAKGRKYFAV